jgi:hypothetical protein
MIPSASKEHSKVAGMQKCNGGSYLYEIRQCGAGMYEVGMFL